MSTFIARFNSACSECPDRIYEGDECIFIGGRISHAICPETIDVLEPERPICPSCHMILPVSMICGSCE